MGSCKVGEHGRLVYWRAELMESFENIGSKNPTSSRIEEASGAVQCNGEGGR